MGTTHTHEHNHAGQAEAHTHGHSHDESLEQHIHDHHLTHTHTPSVTHENQRKTLLALLLIFTFMIVEVIGGVVSGSLALLSDAGHMLTDSMSLALAYVAFRFSTRGPDGKRTFGYLRFEVLAGFINALTLFAIAVWIIYEAWQRLQQPPVILAGPMLIVAVLGLCINLLVLWIMTRGDTHNVNIRGAILHVVGDLLGSVGAILAAVVIYFTGWAPIDPILAVVVAILILRSAWTLLSKTTHILLEGAPADATPEKIEAGLRKAVPNLAEVHHIHVWQLTSGQVIATMQIRAQSDNNARFVVQQVKEKLHELFDIGHATVEIDWNTEMPADAEFFCNGHCCAYSAKQHRE